MEHGGEDPPAGEQGGQLGTHECPRDQPQLRADRCFHLLHTLQSRGAMGHGREGPPAGEQGGQLGTHECPRGREDPKNHSCVLTVAFISLTPYSPEELWDRVEKVPL